MTTFQKIIKGFAIAFAVFLIVNICFGILSALGIVFGISDIYNNSKRIDIQKEFDTTYITDIEISSTISSIEVLRGNTLKVEAINVGDDIVLEEKNDRLIIKENDKNNFFKSNEVSKIKIYIPDSLHLERFELNSGVGETFIDYIKSDNIIFDLGVGNISISKMESDRTKINSGVGNLEIKSGEIGEADFDLGVGNTKINAILTGENKIECGVGEVDINLLRSADGYEIEVEKGLGEVQINNDKISGDTKYGTGLNKVFIKAGMGNINIKVRE